MGYLAYLLDVVTMGGPINYFWPLGNNEASGLWFRV